MSNFKKLCEQLEAKIQNSYEQGTTLEQAEKLAAEFLFAMMQVSTELKKADLDSRLRKAGVKAIRGAIYLEIVLKADKKPVEAQLSAMIDTDKLVIDEQAAYDTAEVEKAELERYYDVFNNSHIFYRGVSRGNFGS